MDSCAMEWLPRGACGPWSDFLMGRYVTANLLIGMAYFLIPMVLFRAASRERRQPRDDLAALTMGERTLVRTVFGVFIGSCGTTHLVENVGAFAWPNYQLFTVLHEITAVASWAAVVTVIRLRAKIVVGV